MKTATSFRTDTTAASAVASASSGLPSSLPLSPSVPPHKNFLHAQSDGLKVFALSYTTINYKEID